MKEIVKWIVKDGDGKTQIYESYVEAYEVYCDMKEQGDDKVTIEKDQKFLLQE